MKPSTRQTRRSRWLTSTLLGFVFLTGLLTIVASGGGGGSATTETDPVITADNAETIALSAYEQGKAAVDTGTGSYETVRIRQPETSSPRALMLTGLVMDFMGQAGLTAPGTARASLSSLKSETITGPCGGQAELTAEIDTLDQKFSLEALFSDYCMNPGILLDGAMEISGTIDLIRDRILSFSVTLSSFNVLVSETGDSSTVSGVMALTLADYDEITGLLDLSLTDENSGKSYVLDAFTVTLEGLLSTVMTFTMDGSFIDPDNGTFSVATTTPFKINKTDVRPYQGVLLVTAADGGSVELAVISAASCRIRADFDGDGDWDFDTGAVSWP